MLAGVPVLITRLMACALMQAQNVEVWGAGSPAYPVCCGSCHLCDPSMLSSCLPPPYPHPQWDTTAIGDGSVGVVALQIRSMMRVRTVWVGLAIGWGLPCHARRAPCCGQLRSILYPLRLPQDGMKPHNQLPCSFRSGLKLLHPCLTACACRTT